MSGTCTAYGTREALEERLKNTSYAKEIFSWINLLILVFFVLVLWAGRYVYSLPFLVHDAGRKDKVKTSRSALRNKRMQAKSTRRLSVHQRTAVEDTTSAELAPLKQMAPPPSTSSAYSGAVAEASSVAAAASGEDVVPVVGGSGAAGETRAATTAEEGVRAGAALHNVDAIEVEAFVSLEKQLVENDNPAVALSYTGFMVALCLIITGPRTPPLPVGDEDVWETFGDIVLWAALGVGLLGLSTVVTERIVLYSLLARDSLLRGNVVTGVVECSSYIACGMIIRVVLSGEVERPFVESIASVAIYWALGQVALLLSTWILQIITPYDDQKEARRGNFAAGVKFAGNTIASALIIQSPLVKSESLLAFGLYYALAMVLLVVVRAASSKLLLPTQAGRSVDKEIEEDSNYGIALAEAALSIAIAVAIDSTLPPLPCPCST